MDSAGLRAGERIILTLWVGSLWAIGYIAVPALFANLEDRALAGTLAAVMFEIVAYIGIVCSSLLLLFNLLRTPGWRLNWRAIVLSIMLLLVIVGQFVVAPLIGELRGAGAVASPAFAWLHAAASFAYLVTSLLGVALVVFPEAMQPLQGCNHGPP